MCGAEARRARVRISHAFRLARFDSRDYCIAATCVSACGEGRVEVGIPRHTRRDTHTRIRRCIHHAYPPLPPTPPSHPRHPPTHPPRCRIFTRTIYEPRRSSYRWSMLKRAPCDAILWPLSSRDYLWSWGLLGPSWSHLRASWGRLAPSLTQFGRLGALLDRLGAVLDPSWTVLGASWAVLGASGRPKRAIRPGMPTTIPLCTPPKKGFAP